MATGMVESGFYTIDANAMSIAGRFGSSFFFNAYGMNQLGDMV